MTYAIKNQNVVTIGKAGISGDILAPTWYKHLRFDNGTTDFAAIAVLADIISWYRPIRLKDEETGEPLPWKQRFKADKLQRSYAQIAKKYGISKDTAKAIIDRLVGYGVITREFRTVTTENVTLTNVMYIDIVIERIQQISFPESKGVPDTPTISPSDPPSIHLPDTPTISPSDGETYTYTTTPITITQETTQEREPADKIEPVSQPSPALSSSQSSAAEQSVDGIFVIDLDTEIETSQAPKRNLVESLCDVCSCVVTQAQDQCADCGRRIVWLNSKTWKGRFGNPKRALEGEQKWRKPNTEACAYLFSRFGVTKFAYKGDADNWQHIEETLPLEAIKEVVNYVRGPKKDGSEEKGYAAVRHAINLAKQKLCEYEQSGDGALPAETTPEVVSIGGVPEVVSIR